MTGAAPKSRNPLRRLYDWVLAWAERPSGEWALWGLAFAEASFFPIPPDVLLIALILGKRARAWRFALGCTVASVLGGAAGYAIGIGLWEAAEPVFIPAVFSREAFDHVRSLYAENTATATFLAAFTIIPFKVFTIAAGVMEAPFAPFVAAALVGRGGRFLLVAVLFYRMGDRAKRFIDRRFNWLVLALAVLGIAGFVVIQYMV